MPVQLLFGAGAINAPKQHQSYKSSGKHEDSINHTEQHIHTQATAPPYEEPGNHTEEQLAPGELR